MIFGNANGLLTERISVVGAETGDDAGKLVSNAGDVNGDGFADFIMTSDGESHVIFGFNRDAGAQRQVGNESANTLTAN